MKTISLSQTMRSALVAFLSVFIISTFVSCSSDDDGNQTDNWMSWVGYVHLDLSTKGSVKVKYTDVRVNPQQTQCYVEGHYYNITPYTNWSYRISDGTFIFSRKTCYFFESNSKGYMLLPDNNLLSEVYLCDSEYQAIKQGCYKISLGGSGSSSGSGSTGGGSGSSSDDVAGHTYYKTVTALVFTEVSSKTTGYEFKNVDIYKRERITIFVSELTNSLYLRATDIPPMVIIAYPDIIISL